MSEGPGLAEDMNGVAELVRSRSYPIVRSWG